MAERHPGGGLLVLLGTPTPESTRLYALSVTSGDPSWAGALAGVALGLPVYHVTEPAIRQHIPPEAYDEHVGLMELALDTDAIAEAVRAVRDGAA